MRCGGNHGRSGDVHDGVMIRFQAARTAAAMALLSVLIAVVAGCGGRPSSSPVAPAGGSAPSTSTQSAAALSTPPASSGDGTVVPSVAGLPTPPPLPPIDPSIAPVSASHPSADAKAALTACSAYELGLDHVAGMGRIAHARDAVRYARLSERAPLLQSDAPVWMVQFTGGIPRLLGGELWVDRHASSPAVRLSSMRRGRSSTSRAAR